ncbi:DsbA family protein [Oscillochloris sp. ZM17-4]|uniref:thioredoxin domain-containing protein n=1 Tax=Oscillochloris sp. ZM17-4 TaxID=2866714 RepID=UPI001C738816|nr:thioredoxin domain-containing protein [Oscillochloris sp. ZM17-4]MBX0326386.1 DsbA family protein [Oscillochloris sp. ZM17-4]
MSVQGQRGRKVTRKSRNSLTTFYMLVGGVLVLVLGFVGVFALRGGFSSTVTPVTAAVGTTADGYYYKGNPDAPVKVIEYGDYQCPSCAFYDKSLAPIIDRDYVNTGKVQFIYHELPLTSIHPNAQVSAEAARCAGDQDVAKYWQMHDMLFLNQDQWAGLSSPQNTFSSYAGQLGLDRGAFDSCLSSGANTAVIQAAEQAGIAAGIQATPTFDVNGTQVSANEVAATIDAALRALGQ